jgi:hypothetical protein
MVIDRPLILLAEIVPVCALRRNTVGTPPVE